MITRSTKQTAFVIVALTALLFVQGFACQKRSSSSGGGGGQTTKACNSKTGLPEALPFCSPSNICTNLSAELVAEGITEISTPSPVPNCHTTNLAQRANYNDGAPYSTTGIDGNTRYACLFKPAGAGSRPLVIWFHPGGGGTADLVYDQTHIRKKAIDYQLGAGASGFVLVSVQGRALEYPMVDPRDGYHHDFFFRDLKSPSKNPDIHFTDHLIDKMVSEGGVDTSRIYVMGWSNGAMFAQMYALARKTTSTPGGHRVAAAAVFSGGDPFHNVVTEDEDPSCRLNPYPAKNTPIFIVRRSCDAALACNPQQQGWFATPPGHDTETWVNFASTLAMNVNVKTVDGRGNPVAGCKQTIEECATDAYGIAAVPGCMPPVAPGNVQMCAEKASITNHLRWPDGVLDNSAKDYEVDMLEFLKSHSL